MNLKGLFDEHTGALIHKWHHYFDIYERYFSKYKEKDINILEIGISHGGSLELWKKYFGSKAKIFAIDVNPACKKFETEQVKIFIGSQSDPIFLKSVADQCPSFDIILDDGGHTMKQQIISFEILFPYLKNDGVYMCEDTHTSYWYEYQGGLNKKGTFIEYSKKLVDKLNAWHVNDSSKMRVDNYTKTINSIHFYDSIVVFEKCLQREKPITLINGKKQNEDFTEPDIREHDFFSRVTTKIKKWIQ